MGAPEVRYASSGDVQIAYSVVGNGPFDLVFISGWLLSVLEYAWEGPPAAFFTRLAQFARLIIFDKRGTGLSDRVTGIPDLETRMDDVRAVMDAAGSKRAAIMGVSEGGPMTALFAATYPERTAAAILYGTGAKWVRSDDYPWGATREELMQRAARIEQIWGTDEYADQRLRDFAPSHAEDPDLKRWWRRLLRLSASPQAAKALNRMNIEIDVRHVLSAISVPTLILHPVGDQIFTVECARYAAKRIPGSELVELPGRDHLWMVRTEEIAGQVERFLTSLWQRNEWGSEESERILATVLFTDIVDSTARAAELGDRRWRELLEQHHSIVRRQLARFRGREISTTGDGFFASFDGPARAIRCATSISKAVEQLGIQVRAGLHTGECERTDGTMTGIAINIGARVAALAGPGEVLVSNTVKDIVSGSGLQFADRGTSQLKGVPGEWRLFAVVSAVVS